MVLTAVLLGAPMVSCAQDRRTGPEAGALSEGSADREGGAVSEGSADSEAGADPKGSADPERNAARERGAASDSAPQAEGAEPACRAEDGSEGVTVTYLGNEGFLLSAGGDRVLVDALFTDGLGVYTTVPEPLRSELEVDTGRFADVDLVLATHVHRDHFDPVSVGRFMRAHPAATFVGTSQAADSLGRYVEGYAALASRVTTSAPGEGERIGRTVSGIQVETLGIPHPASRNQPVQHVGYLLRLGGRTVLHLGDAGTDAAPFARLDLARDGVDLALVPSWFLLGNGGRELLEERVRPRRVLAMHVPAEETREVAADIASAYPAAAVLTEPGQSGCF